MILKISHLSFIGKGNKTELSIVLSSQLSGLARSPAMCFGKIKMSTKDLNLQSYAISMVEPLHDLKGHIKNVWDVFPNVLSPETKTVFDAELSVALGIDGE